METMNSEHAVTMLAALAHERRLAMFRLLIERGPNGMTAGEIAKSIGIGATGTSFHLKEMTRAGLVQSTRQGRYIRYAVVVEAVRDLLGFLTEDCCAGHPELCGATFTTGPLLCGSTERSDEETDV